MQHGHKNVKKKIQWKCCQKWDFKRHWTQTGQQTVRAELPKGAMTDTKNCRNTRRQSRLFMSPIQTSMSDIKSANFTALLNNHGESAFRNVTEPGPGPGKSDSLLDCRTKKKRQPLCVQRNNKARSRNHCCSEKAISITYCECVCV